MGIKYAVLLLHTKLEQAGIELSIVGDGVAGFLPVFSTYEAALDFANGNPDNILELVEPTDKGAG